MQLYNIREVTAQMLTQRTYQGGSGAQTTACPCTLQSRRMRPRHSSLNQTLSTNDKDSYSLDASLRPKEHTHSAMQTIYQQLITMG